MGSRRENLVRIEVIEHKNGIQKSTYHYYRVYMKNDSPEYNDLYTAKFFLNFLSTIDLVNKPYSLFDIDICKEKDNEFMKDYGYNICDWTKALYPDSLPAKTIQSLVEEIEERTPADYSGLILEIKYNYYHDDNVEQKIHVSDLLMYGWITENSKPDIVPFDLYTLYHKREVDTEESIKRYKYDKTLYQKIQLIDGQYATVRKSIKDFQEYSTYVKETFNKELPLLCNICHKPIFNKESKPFFLFEDGGLIEKEIKKFPNKDVPFTKEEKNKIRDEYKYYLTSEYGIEEHYTGMKIKVYHHNCLKGE